VPRVQAPSPSLFPLPSLASLFHATDTPLRVHVKKAPIKVRNPTCHPACSMVNGIRSPGVGMVCLSIDSMARGQTTLHTIHCRQARKRSKSNQEKSTLVGLACCPSIAKLQEPTPVPIRPPSLSSAPSLPFSHSNPPRGNGEKKTRRLSHNARSATPDVEAASGVPS